MPTPVAWNTAANTPDALAEDAAAPIDVSLVP